MGVHKVDIKPKHVKAIEQAGYAVSHSMNDVNTWTLGVAPLTNTEKKELLKLLRKLERIDD